MSAAAEGTSGGAPVRVVVVDDLDDVRLLVRLSFELDGRFEVVGEGVDGRAAIELARDLQPDLLLLDRSMPGMSGLDALPRVREVAPDTAVVLYTAEDDEPTVQVAMASGAVGVLPKTVAGMEMTGRLAETLVGHWAPSRGASIHVGPVPASAAVAWTENTQRILRLVREHPELLDEPVDEAMFDAFEAYVAAWHDVAAGADEFRWTASVDPAEIDDLLEAWRRIDAVPEERLAEHGLGWSDPHGRLFFTALSTAVLEGLERYGVHAELARRLQTQWTAGGEPQSR